MLTLHNDALAVICCLVDNLNAAQVSSRHEHLEPNVPVNFYAVRPDRR